MPKSSNLNTSGFAHVMIVFPIVFLLVGAVGGYLYAKNSVSTMPKSEVKTTPVELDKTTPILTKVITDTRKQWGDLVRTVYAEISVNGELVSIDETNQKILDGRTIKGWKVVLKKGSKQQAFFVRESTDVEEGDINKFSTWKKIETSSLKPGDNITIKLNAPITGDSGPDAYIGWWIFKQI